MTDLAFRDQLAADIEKWKRQNYAPSLLYSSYELRQAVNYMRENPVSEGEWTFIEMSIRHDVPRDIVEFISYEFHTPLTSVEGYCDLLLVKEYFGSLTDSQQE